MKKTLSLIAIVGLLLTIALVSPVLANAPVYPEVPSVKLFISGSGLTPAFDLAKYNTAPDAFNADSAATYANVVNFLNQNSFAASAFSGASSNVNVGGGYSSATDGISTWATANSGGAVSSSTVSNKIKFSTYRQNEFLKYGLTVGSSVTVPVSAYILSTSAAVIAPSFGNSSSIIVSDTTKVTAVWNASTTGVVVTLNVGTTAPVYVDVIAAPSGAIGADQDKERIEVYTNLFSGGVFSGSAANTAAWGLQVAPGKTTQTPATWVSADTDSQGTVIPGAWQFTAADANSGVKGTPTNANYIAMSAGKWYITRMRLFDKAVSNTDLALVFSFTSTISGGVSVDVAADSYANGIPNYLTWLEAPVYAHTANTGFPQFQLKSSGAGTIDIAEIQVIQATPRLVDGKRGIGRSFLPGGLFAISTSSTLWGQQVYAGAAGPPPTIIYASDTVIGSSLSATFTGANSSNLLGYKWTYGAQGGIVTTPVAPIGKQYGVTAQLTSTIPSSGTELSLFLVACYGVPSSGAATPLDRIEAAAEAGVLVNGTVATIGTASDGFAQVQFGVRGDAVGTVNVANVDFISDTNDVSSYGDFGLFP